MPSRHSEQERLVDWIDDILENVGRAREATRGLSRETFLADWRAQYMVQHALLIVSEAARRLPEDVMRRHPAVPWPKVRALRNAYTHEYHHVDPLSVWATATTALDALEAAMAAERDRLKRRREP